ncbi:hypothetical protein Bca52824_070755 [Brassica carinata]|uniref:Uncharacterized protein n=1 Tax=Brassica carinata TaxID=52824 RepID=A0A8X7U5D2_BRACI|nr:hypothetical protein Bca52824_070755 [Brassica carinata]
MEQTLREDATTSWERLCIYRVPQYLQENDNKSYFPQTVSLGPYHHGKDHLLPMDRHKWRAVNMIMARTKQGIEMYLDAMKELEERARACYEGPIGLSSNKFTEMLVLDGCFVLELFRGADKLGYDRNDPVFAMRGSMHSIQRDMVMLENQLPLFVLNRLLELQLSPQNQTGLVAQLAIRFFDPLMPTNEPLTKTNQSNIGKDKFFNPIADKDKEELHCLDVFRRSLLRPSTKPEPRLSRRRWSWKTRVADKRQQQLIHCVTELREADSPQDVSYLHYCGIIEHWLGSDLEVDRNYSRKWNVMKAVLKHKYFNNPWAYFSFFAALVLLVLTLFQSF